MIITLRGGLSYMVEVTARPRRICSLPRLWVWNAGHPHCKNHFAGHCGGGAMAMLLRRLWNSVFQCPSRFPTEEDLDSDGSKLPPDVLAMILKCLGPKAAARASLVCKAWQYAAADDQLWMYFLKEEAAEVWPSVLFAETYLRAGCTLRSVVIDAYPGLPFQLIYSQRIQLQRSVIIDGGQGYCKYGWSTYVRPLGRAATFLEFGNVESPMYSKLNHFFQSVYNRLQVKPSLQPVVISTPICHWDDTDSTTAARRQLREAIYTVLFNMNVPSICAIDQAILALYAAQHTSGIVVNIGFQVTSIVPILHGKVMRHVGVEVVGQGALRLTGYLSEMMHSNGNDFASMSTVRILKENLCYVAEDYHAELTKNVEASFSVGIEGVFTLSHERFKTGEILFQPQLGGLRAMGLHQAVALCMDHCNAAEVGTSTDEGWFKTVVLAGGSACLPGLAGRLEKELFKTLPSSMSKGIKVIPPPRGADSAWFGAKIISNLSTFPQVWCVTKKQFRQHGAQIVHARALDDD